MSRENVEAVRSALARFPQDPESVAAWLADFWEDDADYYPVRKFPEARPCHGADEIGRFMALFIAAWDRWDNQPLDVVPIGDTRVAVRSRVIAEGRGSGIGLDGDLYQCVWLRRRRVLRMEDHLTLEGAAHALGVDAEALEAVGLSE